MDFDLIGLPCKNKSSGQGKSTEYNILFDYLGFVVCFLFTIVLRLVPGRCPARKSGQRSGQHLVRISKGELVKTFKRD